MNQNISTRNILGTVAIIGAVIVLVTFLVLNREEAGAGSFPGSVAQIGVNNISGSTTQQFLVSHVSTQIFGTSTCATRTITTTSYPIRLSFYDGAPSLGIYNGHIQAASTTEHYENEKIGCGLMRAFALIDGQVASTSITITETR